MSQHGALRVILAQLRFRVGDIQANLARMVTAATRARDEYSGDVVVFPQLALTGYPPQDLLWRGALAKTIATALAELRAAVQGITVVVGYPEFDAGHIYNAAVVLRDGQQLANYRKQVLADPVVGDEQRYFTAGAGAALFEQAGWRLAITMDEDLAGPEQDARLQARGADALISLAASPFHANVQAEREARLQACVAATGLPLCQVNHVGGQGELIFDGSSLALDATGVITTHAPLFENGLYCVDWPAASATAGVVPAMTQEQQVYEALVQATRDYVLENGFSSVLLGASGGIDSALVMAIAVDALGAGYVHALAMPSRYTAAISNADAANQAARLGVNYQELSIEALFDQFLDALAPLFGDLPADATEENLQARIRGILLMAWSNKFGSLLLATGNKSESAVGYATLYGDMCGGYAPLKDVYKSWVYRLARYRNTLSAAIPERVIMRPPSAELRAEQLDSDSLPDYATLDAIIEAYVEADESIESICAQGYDAATVERVTALIRGSEYKRAQAAPGPAITRRPFDGSRRYPLAATWQAL